ncbi:Trehalase [Pseudoalteromonas luteoviolacea B = ATCC 29581]|nr:Trehalase [Pseudoalteromonas luteoviolacea B = ATCC 29581]
MKFEHSALFQAVQLSGLFQDSKTFADVIPKISWQHAIETYDLQKPELSQLSLFIDEHFEYPKSPELEPLAESHSVESYIDALWPRLERPKKTTGEGSLLPLPHPYIVPGGRFNEIYYWDSYFTALGLIDAGKIDAVNGMLLNFTALINTFGHVPNGNRSYYLSRSQPPVTALMVDLLWPYFCDDRDWVASTTQALEKEYEFWMQGCEELGPHCEATRRVVKMPCGRVLNRYWDEETTPRPESYREDLHLADSLPIEKRADFYRSIRAACESGWDFSARWLDEPDDLTSINTIQRVPVDLNGLMYLLEEQIAQGMLAMGDEIKSQWYRQKARSRKHALHLYCWSNARGWYMDYHIGDKSMTSIESLAASVLLFANLVSAEQAQLMSEKIAKDFLKVGGLVTTLESTSQQWDSPNGWAPLHWFSVKGLINYGRYELARCIMDAWLATVEADFKRHQCLLEKYNVCDRNVKAGGGEYLVQQGFGWTNGVTKRFYTIRKLEQNLKTNRT